MSLTDAEWAAFLAAQSAAVRRQLLALPLAERETVMSWLYGGNDVSGLAGDIASLRTATYIQRLTELGQKLGGVAPGSLDRATAERIASESARVAAGIGQTHNADLLEFVNKLGPNPSDLAQAILDWEKNRADWKSRQIAYTEAMTERNQADRDFVSENGLDVQMYVVPQDAVCDECQAAVDAGVMSSDDAGEWDFPLHPNCQHSWAYVDNLTDAVGNGDIWLGSTIKREAA